MEDQARLNDGMEVVVVFWYKQKMMSSILDQNLDLVAELSNA
jgi:hypothetical protein